MNDRNLAIQISKHPLIRKLLETKMATKSVVARLIVEEMIISEVDLGAAKSNLRTRLTKITKIEDNAKKKAELENFIKKLQANPGAYFKKYNEFSEEQRKEYDAKANAVVNLAIEFLKETDQLINAVEQADTPKQKEEVAAAEEKIEAEQEKKLAAAETEEAQPEEPAAEPEEKEQLKLPEISKEAKKIYIGTNLYKAFGGNRVAQMAILYFLHFFRNIPVQEAALRDLEEPARKRIGKAISQLQQVSPDMAKQLVAILKQKPELVAQAIQQIATYPSETQIDALFADEEETDAEEAEVEPEEQEGEDAEETGTEEEPEVEKDEEAEEEQEGEAEEEEAEAEEQDFQVSEDTLSELRESVEEFITEFYEVPFITEQAKLVKAMMAALAKVKQELKKEPEQQAGFRGQAKRPKAPQNEQQEQVSASEDLLKNIRVDLRAFLKLTKKTKAALDIFKKNAEKGSLLTDSSKEKFMELVARLQTTVAEIVGDLKKMSTLNEEQQPEKETWEIVQGFYNQAADSLDGLVGVLEGGGPDESPEELIGTASENLLSLTQYFPSVNPFNVGKKDLGDLNNYDTEFEAAVKEVKSHVQNVLALVKEKVGGRASIRETILGLEEFSGKIQNIFGVESKLEDVKVSSEDEAIKGETADIQQVPDPKKAERVLELPDPEELSDEDREDLLDIDLDDETEKILRQVATVAVDPRSVQDLDSEQKEEAEKEAVEFVQAVQDETEPLQDKGITRDALENKSPTDYFKEMYKGPLEFDTGAGKKKEKKDITPILEKLFTYFDEEVKKLNLSEDLQSVKANLKELQGATEALEAALDRLSGYEDEEADKEKEEDFRMFLDFIGSREAGQIGKKGTGQNLAIEPFTKTLIAIYNAKSEIKKQTEKEKEKKPAVDTTEIIRTIVRLKDKDKSPDDITKKLSRETDFTQVSKDDFAEIEKELKAQEEYNKNPGFFQSVLDLITNQEINRKRNTNNTKFALNAIKKANTVEKLIKVDKQFFGNKYTSDKLKKPWRKKLEKVARNVIDGATKDDKKELLNIINGEELIEHFWLAEPANQEVYKLAVEKFKKLFRSEQSDSGVPDPTKRSGSLEEKLSNKIKPLIREMLKKGR